MAERPRCEECDRTFKDEFGFKAHNAAKHSGEEMKKKPKGILSRKTMNWAIALVVFGAILGGIVWLINSIETLPPTTMQGHIEASPASHILKEQMPLAIQKHMLEHSDETGPPGVIINYNCKQYDCEPDLIEKLESFVEKYPDHVYVSPFKGMDAKIALTKLGKIEILEEFDEEKIEAFI